jgi:hypothetical protein
MKLWFKKLWFCWILRRHYWWRLMTFGSGINYRTGELITESHEHSVCLWCKKRLPEFD